MAEYQIAYNNVTKNAVVQFKGDALPAPAGGANFYNIGTFEHDDVEPAVTDLEYDVNHVFFHHVRDALYHVNAVTGQAVPGTLQFPNNITDMEGITITVDATYVAVTGISTLPATVSLLIAATQQLANTFTPVSPSNTGVTYTSSAPAIATVSATGLITAVAVGTATITVTTVDGGFTDTCVVTVTAA